MFGYVDNESFVLYGAVMLFFLKGEKTMVKKVVRSFCSVSYTGLKRLDGRSEHVESLADFWGSRGLVQAKNEAHAEQLLEQGKSCFLIEGNRGSS